MSEHVLGGRLIPSDLANGVLDDGCFGAWSSGVSILAKRNLLKGLSASVWVDVEVDVGDTHCECCKRRKAGWR